jgi:LmbE family N-acetylglucosaminyl deacetylase
VATLVFFHAHPDDEAIATGGTMARASADGHRVVLVIATKGELGERPDDLGSDGDLAARRVEETHAAAEILGVHRVEFLGFHDSGMAGDSANEAVHAFFQADIDEAAGRLAHILDEESADVLTVYDANGSYGHPDHIQVHRVGIRAAEIAGTESVFESTIDRDHVRELATQGQDLLADFAEEPPNLEEIEQLGTPGALITTRVDVTAFIKEKRAAMAAHASQIPETSWFLSLPEDIFPMMFGTEWYVQRKAPAPLTDRLFN